MSKFETLGRIDAEPSFGAYACVRKWRALCTAVLVGLSHLVYPRTLKALKDKPCASRNLEGFIGAALPENGSLQLQTPLRVSSGTWEYSMMSELLQKSMTQLLSCCAVWVHTSTFHIRCQRGKTLKRPRCDFLPSCGRQFTEGCAGTMGDGLRKYTQVQAGAIWAGSRRKLKRHVLLIKPSAGVPSLGTVSWQI